MRHILKLARDPDGGYSAHDPNLPWLKSSHGRTPEEAIDRFETRLRFVDVEKRVARNWLERRLGTLGLLPRLARELFRAAGLAFLRRPLRFAVILLVVLPLLLSVIAVVGR